MQLCQECILVIQIVSCVLGVIMNSLVVLVRLVKLSHRRRISSYHFIILNIAIADLFFALLILIDINTKDFIWPYSEGACQFVKPLKVITGDIPGFFMVLLAFERYQGTIKPLGQRFRMRTLMAICFMLWFFTVGLAFPYGFYLKMRNINNETYCVSDYPFAKFREFYGYVQLTFFVVIPFIATSSLHVMICLAIKKHSSKMSQILKHTADLHQKICITSRFSSQDDHSPNPDSERYPSIDSVFFPDNNKPKSKNIIKDLFHRFDICRCASSQTAGGAEPSKKQRSPFQWGIKLKIHILILISIAFFFCMFPNHLYQQLYIHKKLNTINFNLLVIFTWMKFFHCFVNGFVYSLLDERFRSDLRSIFKSMFTCKPHYKLEFRRSVLSQTSVDTTTL